MRFFMTFIYLFIYINKKGYNNLWETTYSVRWKRGAKVENFGGKEGKSGKLLWKRGQKWKTLD